MECALCPLGCYTTENGSSQCHTCPIGHYCPSGDEEPVLCPPGTSNALHSQTYCGICAAGQYSVESGAIYCKTCPVGSYCTHGHESPKPCPAGSYCLEGQIEGTPCPTGYQTTLTGQSYCNICSPGIYFEHIRLN